MTRICKKELDSHRRYLRISHLNWCKMLYVFRILLSISNLLLDRNWERMRFFHSLVSPSTGFYSGVLGIVSCFLTVILFLTIAAIDLPNSQSLLVPFPDSSVVPIALQRNNKETLQECRILGAELNAGIAPRRKKLIGGCFSKGRGPKSDLFISTHFS